MARDSGPPPGARDGENQEAADPRVRRLAGILDRMNSLVLLVESDGTLSYWNRPAAERLRDSQEVPLGRPLIELVHPRDSSRVAEVVAEIFREGPGAEADDQRDFRFRMKSAPGREWSFFVARPYTFSVPDCGAVVCLLVLREDMERRKAEPWRERVQVLEEEVEEKTRRLAESESDYRALIQAMNDGFCVLDNEGRMQIVNEKLADLLGYAPSQLTGWLATRFFDDRNREIFLGQLRERDLGRQGTYEIEAIRRNGKRITCLIRAAPRFDAEGRIIGSICNITDISARKALENRLKASEQDYRDLFENMQDVICRMSPAGEIVALNPVGARVLGFERTQDVLWRKLKAFFANPEDWEPFQAEIEARGLVEDHVVRLRHPDGTLVTVSISAHLVLDEQGRPAGIDGVFRDVSERMRLEDRLQTYARDMEKKNQELESLIYSITHDFKSPLVVLGGLLARLKKTSAGILDEKRLEYLDWMQGSVSKMDKMVNDLLFFYRADKNLLSLEPVSLGSLVDTVLRDVEPLAREKRVRLRKQGKFPAVNGYRNRLYQAFYNLVENAVKFMDQAEEGVVEIGYGLREGQEHLFYVRDNGPGIAPEHRDKVFQIFFTLEPERLSGTGIGLSIVKKIIESHGGRIWVESEVGQGTVFRFSLPAPGDS